MSQQIRPLATVPAVCWNCGKTTQDYKTYWYNPRIKEYPDGPRLVFPHINVCADCQVKPFSNKKTLARITVSDILGQPITEKKWNMITEPRSI